MRYLLFDESAIDVYVSTNILQSIDYAQGLRFINHIRGELHSELFEGTAIEYCDDGILFVGGEAADAQKKSPAAGQKVFCIDLFHCGITVENDSQLLLILQKIFRTSLKIWHRQPFSSSERIHGSKSIVFPFAYPDGRRVVVERSRTTLQLNENCIDFPLLAYKYNAEDPPQDEESIDISTLQAAAISYSQKRDELKHKLEKDALSTKNAAAGDDKPLRSIAATKEVWRDDFIYWTYEQQYGKLTESQKEVVDYTELTSPLRVDGAAGTGKTISLIMRAYKLLKEHKEKGAPFNIIFVAHSQSTYQRNRDIFNNYIYSGDFLEQDSLQHIEFITLSDFCLRFAKIPEGTIAERDAGDAKNYQLQMIEKIWEQAVHANTVRTYRSQLSQKMQEVINVDKTTLNALFSMLQHEFSVQIKGRTDGTIDTYYKIPSIPNGLPCETDKDKDFVFLLFSNYQKELESLGEFDIDDVVMEALSRLNAPVWRRERAMQGYDYIFVDEMHLFNVNEQSVFHYLTKDLGQKDIPICFALDYSQAIGDRGDVSVDYIEKAFGKTQNKEYNTVFRNSPQITNFCAAIAASGILMFHDRFSNPYNSTKSSFSKSEERKSQIPSLYLYDSDDTMLRSLKRHISSITKDLQCKAHDIAIIAFDSKFYSEKGIAEISKLTGREFTALGKTLKLNKYIITSPYDINGLEFQAVILLGVDEGRVPQTMGTSDISQHFIKYSAYNMLYLASSRAKYRLILLGNRLKGRSSCLEHSIETKYLEIKKE